MSLEQVFVEQAEYLEDASFAQWHAQHPDESKILRKLTQGGAKLISGPRGCGKTTLLLKAFHTMLKNSDAAFPVYVNYKRSLSIEPIYKSGTDGTYWFNQWIILKIYVGIYETLDRLGCHTQLSISLGEAKKAASQLEMSNASSVNLHSLSVPMLEQDIDRISEKVNRSRCILLLDDAAHAFSTDQQQDFFDFFRQIKSQSISPKAAVYPGVTNYSSSFHVGHDAEQIDVWIKPDRDGYLEFMRQFIRSRFPDEVASAFLNSETIDFLSYASFGIPRALLNMLQELSIEKDGQLDRISLSRNDVLRAVKQHYASTKKLFTTIASKLPVYRTFINTGEVILANSIELIKSYNKGKPADRQSVSIAIASDELSHELSKVFALFQYAGLCIPKDELVSRGEKGRFQLYVMHYAGLIDGNALIGAKSLNMRDYVTAYTKRNAHEFTRTRSSVLIGKTEGAFDLSLPPCNVCHTPRPFEDAKFCVKCGTPLTSPSTYLALMNADISELPLTDTRIQKIKKQSKILKIKDILFDTEHKQLLGVDRVGKYWAARIVGLAEEFVE
jgi:energy-coupling factor transporter ATP-binding protein EcfA2